MPLKIYTDPSQSETAVSLIKDLDLLDTKLQEIKKIETEEQAAQLGEFRAQANQRRRDLDDERKEMGAGARETLAKLNAKFKAPIDKAERLVQICDNLLRPYLAEQRRLRQEQEAAAERLRIEAEEAEQRAREAEAEARRIAEETTDRAKLKEAEDKLRDARGNVDALRRSPVPVVPPKSLTASHGSKVALKQNWRWRVVDLAAVPEEYRLPPDECVRKGPLTKLARAQQEMAVVPGIEFYAEDTIASTTQK